MIVAIPPSKMYVAIMGVDNCSKLLVSNIINMFVSDKGSWVVLGLHMQNIERHTHSFSQETKVDRHSQKREIQPAALLKQTKKKTDHIQC